VATHGLPIWPWTETAADALPPAEALLLEAMRRWSAAAALGQPALPAARLPLMTEDAGDAAVSLDALLRIGAARFSIGSPLQLQLTGDEPALLLGFALAQRGSRREALAAFLRLLSPTAAYEALVPALGLALALRRAGLLLAHPLR
jgi:hypothetical protein